MKESFEVFWAAVAEEDLFGIVEFIAEENSANASEILQKIRTVTSTLDRSPERGRIVPELLKHGVSSYRELVIPPWRVIYRTEGGRVYIVSVIDSRRNVEDVLLSRLLR